MLTKDRFMMNGFGFGDTLGIKDYRMAIAVR